jgi:hypothetical protein
MQNGESNIMKKTVRLFILAMILLTLITPMQTSAKSSKTVYYSSSYVGKYYKTETPPKLRKIIFKKNKVITYGSFYLQKKWNTNTYKYCRSKKRVFKITKKTKYYLIDEDEHYRCSLKEFKKYLLNMALYIKVRNGKAVALMISP